jgi:glutamate decarboxylase
MLINNSIDKAKHFANMIKQDPDFELITEPELCLLTYRYVPAETQQALAIANTEDKHLLHDLLNDLTKFIQKRQRESGKSFVSRTRLTPEKWDHKITTVFRVVLANPLTTNDILQNVLIEQKELAKDSLHSLPNLLTLTKRILAN